MMALREYGDSHTFIVSKRFIYIMYTTEVVLKRFEQAFDSVQNRFGFSREFFVEQGLNRRKAGAFRGFRTKLSGK